MFISPETAIQEGWITHPACSTLEDWETNKFLSPNAIDFTLDDMFIIEPSKDFAISETNKQMRVLTVNRAKRDQSQLSFWHMLPGMVCDCTSNAYVKVPDGVACQLVIRSTFSRNGLFLTSGLYDSGYQGNVGFALHNPIGHSDIAVGTRVGQIIFVESTNARKYEGGYNHEVGTHWHTSSNITENNSGD